MRAWGPLVLLCCALTACGTATAAGPSGTRTTSPATAPTTTSASPSASPSALPSASPAADPVTSECGSLLHDAGAATATILSYDYHDPAASLAAVRSVTTPAEYARESAFRLDTVGPLAVQHDAVLRATTLATGYVDGGCARPRVLAFARTSATTSAATAPRVTDNQLLLTLRPTAGRYVVDSSADAVTGGAGTASTEPDCPTAAPAAVHVARLTASYDYRRLAAQLPEVGALLTGSALRDFTREQAGIRSSVTSGRTVSTATLDAVGYVGGGCGDPSLLVSLAVSSAADGAAPQAKVQLLEVGLVPHGAGWLATTITPVSAPSS